MNIAIVGATGLVGRQIINLCEEFLPKDASYTLFASSKSAGKKLEVNGNEYEVRELKPYVEKIITLGKKGDLQSKRKTISILHDEKNTRKVFDIFSKRYKDRIGGYTRIIKLDNRYGDNAPTAIVELVDRDEEAKGKDSGPVIEKKSTEEEQN